jgi:hypothetical protein
VFLHKDMGQLDGLGFVQSSLVRATPAARSIPSCSSVITPSVPSWWTASSSRGVHPPSPVQNLRQTLPGWGHSIVIGTFRSYQCSRGLMPAYVAIILDAGGTS